MHQALEESLKRENALQFELKKLNRENTLLSSQAEDIEGRQNSLEDLEEENKKLRNADLKAKVCETQDLNFFLTQMQRKWSNKLNP